MRRDETGFSLIEVLVTALVLSIGLLGLAALQATSLRQNQNAHFRSQATLRAYEIMDRMRANKTVATTGGYDRALGAAKPAQSCATTCTASQMAQADLKEWLDALQTLPGGDGLVSVTAGLATVQVRWTEDRDPAKPQTSFRLTTQL